MAVQEKNTEELILAAASKVFTKKGFAATRTEDIAAEAGINRALLHYYYRDKQSIFNIIFEARFKEFFKGLFVIFEADNLTLFDRIRRIIDHEISSLIKHPDLARFVIMEIAQDPGRLVEYGQKLGINPRLLIATFEKEVALAAEQGIIRQVSGRQLLISIMSLCVYPFVARPIIQTLMQVEDSGFEKMMELRKQEAFDLIANSIKK